MVRFGGYTAGIKRDERTSRTHSLFRTWNMAKWGTGNGLCNNTGLKKLKKRARRAAITCDASLPNDRYLSRCNQRIYAKSLRQRVDDSSNVSSKSYKQTNKITVLHNIILYNIRNILY